ncbi:MAG: CDP-alcohol phosphatidyltransferase family protein [Clostridiales Family XIII bacterium]|jgi:CDP-diacylglycerol--glycerol-3-phosphate 3-phosphatidyltransferase|nr:CDP-alcohol phosphatidyltransferase family protein [Clostridiales Family XIII bacterium]
MLIYWNIPNALSLARGLLVLPFILSIHDIFVHGCADNLVLLLLFSAILLSDVLDGFLARRLQCTSVLGAKLDVLSDTLYTILSLATFAYFGVIPAWFVLVMLLKLAEFIVTSRIIRGRGGADRPLLFDKLGKLSVSAVMLLPGVFVLRCVFTDYKTVMVIAVHALTLPLALSSVGRVRAAIQKARLPVG